MNAEPNRNPIAIYENIDGTVKIDVRVMDESVWLSQMQMAEIFDKDRTVITKHINNVLDDGELDQAVCANFAHTASDGKSYTTKYYNLDMIISVGYLVNSKRGVQFRKWASNILKKYLLQGIASIKINLSIIRSKNYNPQYSMKLSELCLQIHCW